MALRRALAPLVLACLVAPAVAGAHAGDAQGRASELARDAEGARRALEGVQRLERGRGVRTGRELTHVLRDLALRLPALRGEERREAEGYLARPADGASDPFGDGYSVPEQPPVCDANFCVHWVASSADAPPDGVDYVNMVLAELGATRDVENGTLGWRPPVPDGSAGGDARTDVYVKQLGGQGLFGYAAPDAGQAGSVRHAYLVLDNDYRPEEFPGYADPLHPLQVTVAHEYNHVLHYGIDTLEDFWLFEASAVWMEDQVYDSVDDYLNYLPAPRWTAMTRVPLTRFNARDPLDPANIKVYGDAVWNHWLAERHSPEVVRSTWDASIAASSFAPAAYDAALRARGSSFFDEFARFSAAVAEWRTGSGFSEGAAYPDVERLGTLSSGAPSTQLRMDHTTFAFFDVAAGAPQVTLAASIPPGTAGALALVGRAGPDTSGSVATELLGLPGGGRGTVTLRGAAGMSRITAVLVNADVRASGVDPLTGDRLWSRDQQCTTATVSPDQVAPALRLDRAATGVPLTGALQGTFSEPVHCLTADAVQLVDPSGRAVPASVGFDPASRRLTLTPFAPLAESARYRIRIDRRVVDASGNPVSPGELELETLRRPPRFALEVLRAQDARTVLRRGLLLGVRSTDPDRLALAVTLSGTGRAFRSRVLARRRATIRSGGTARLRIRLPRAAARAVRARPAVRLQAGFRVRDPQGNVVRRSRTITVRRQLR